VVFLNGFQSGCPGGESFAGSFGQFDSILQGDGRVTLFFNNCEQGRNQPIEDLGATLGRYLDGLRYADGTPVPQVDVFAHSMGGQIVRLRASVRIPPKSRSAKRCLSQFPSSAGFSRRL
jgi:hypothetical protein